FGLGFIPRRLWGHDGGAGTLGAALGAGISAALWSAGAGWQAAAAGLAIAASLWAAAPFARNGHDPGWVCMDETAGALLGLVGLTGWPWIASLIVGRAADVTKLAPGVRAAENRLPGAVGVTADDLVAGLYGLAAGWALRASGL
ncbi:MAG: phosphatidylglycerophosphatase A, partial [Acidimicrobiia bacterium]